MKWLRFAVLCASVILLAKGAWADQLPAGDPIVKTGGGGGAPIGLAAPGPAGIIVLNFTVTSPSGTSPGTSACVLTQGTIMTTVPACLFENDITSNGSSVNIVGLTFDAPTVAFGSGDMCGFLTGSPFSVCGVDPLTGGGTEFSFSGGSIPFHGDFSLDFEGFAANTSFSVTASASPEPGTLLLFVGGLGALLARRKARCN